MTKITDDSDYPRLYAMRSLECRSRWESTNAIGHYAVMAKGKHPRCCTGDGHSYELSAIFYTEEALIEGGFDLVPGAKVERRYA